MTPDPEHVTEGRLNPRGIAFLYLSREEETAVAEVRPWVGASVSVGVFEVMQDCTLVNCSELGGRGLYLSIDSKGRFVKPERDIWDKLNWEAISYAFARPTDPSDSSLTYAPTQIIAEFLRDEGYDGILYQSALRSEGKNIALFDPKRARLFGCRLYDVDVVEYRTSEVAAPYWLERRTKAPTPVES